MTEQMTLRGTLKGHNGWVTQIATTPQFPDMILSASRGEKEEEETKLQRGGGGRDAGRRLSDRTKWRKPQWEPGEREGRQGLTRAWPGTWHGNFFTGRTGSVDRSQNRRPCVWGCLLTSPRLEVIWEDSASQLKARGGELMWRGVYF